MTVDQARDRYYAADDSTRYRVECICQGFIEARLKQDHPSVAEFNRMLIQAVEMASSESPAPDRKETP